MVEQDTTSTILGKRTHKDVNEQSKDKATDQQTTDQIEGVVNNPSAPAGEDPSAIEYNSQGQRVTQKTLRGFVSTKDGKPLIFTSKLGKHPRSLWRDE